MRVKTLRGVASLLTRQIRTLLHSTRSRWFADADGNGAKSQTIHIDNGLVSVIVTGCNRSLTTQDRLHHYSKRFLCLWNGWG